MTVRSIEGSWPRGFGASVRAMGRAIIDGIVCTRRRLILEADLGVPRPPSSWDNGERMLVLGPESLDSALSIPGLWNFLGGQAAAGELEGVRRGDCLFVIMRGTDCLACSYVFFDVTEATRRQARILGETAHTPIIGMSFTGPRWRGRGLYRRLLNEMFRFLASRMYRRAVCEIEPHNVASIKASEANGMRVCREVTECTILRRACVQMVREADQIRWRALWV